MEAIQIGDIEVSVEPYRERIATIGVYGLGGAGKVSHCQIVLSSLTIFQPPPPGTPIIIGYIDPVTHRIVPIPSTAGDPEKVIVDASITAARLSPSPNTAQDADFGPNVSSATLENASSVIFMLYVKTSTNEAVYARASFTVHTVW
jgi:hypothetical protein